MKLKTTFLVVAIISAFGIGLWLIVSPALDNRNAQDEQQELLYSIAADIAYNALNEQHFVLDTDYHSAAELNELTNPEDFVSEEPNNLSEYESLDDSEFPDAVVGIGILTIDTINLRIPIAEGISEESLRIAPGRVPETAYIGEVGNSVIAGHRNYTFGSMFNRLGEVVIGDIIGYQERSGRTMEFEVFEILEIIPEDQIAFIQPVNDHIITLYTCTPIHTATHRLLVRARRI